MYAFRSPARDISEKHPSIAMTSSVSCANEVASFECSACDSQWLSRPSSVYENGCPHCERREADQYDLLRRAADAHVSNYSFNAGRY